jgi:hypothetical protein
MEVAVVQDEMRLAERRGAERERRRIRRLLTPVVRQLHALCLDFDARKLDEAKHAVYAATKAPRKGKR